MDELQAGVEPALAVLPQASVLLQPGEAALDDPALGHDRKGVQFAAPRYSVVRPLKAEEFETYMSRREEANTRLTVEPDVSQYAPPKSASAGRGQPMRRGVR